MIIYKYQISYQNFLFFCLFEPFFSILLDADFYFYFFIFGSSSSSLLLHKKNIEQKKLKGKFKTFV